MICLSLYLCQLLASFLMCEFVFDDLFNYFSIYYFNFSIFFSFVQATDADWDAPPRVRMLVQAPRDRAGPSARTDEHMLHADTCFFNVTVPDYSSDVILRARIVTAIQCEEMFGDAAAVD